MLSLPHVAPAALHYVLTSYALIAVLVCMALALYRLPLKIAVLVFIAAIPLDPNATVGFLPKLSALDYFAVVAFVVMLARQSPLNFIRKTWNSFPRPSVIFWLLFFIYAGIEAHLSNGNLHGTLRWGEFLFYYVFAQFALLENSDENFSFSIDVSKLLSVVASIISITAIIQFSYAEGNANRACAMFGQRNVMAAFLSLCLPACSVEIPGLSSGWMLVRKAATFLTLCAFVLSYSRGAWIGLTVGICIAAWNLRHSSNFHWNKLKNAILVILILIGPLTTLLIIRNQQRSIFSFSGRPLYWQATWHVLKQHPWVGLGPGNYYKSLPNYLTGNGLAIWNFEKDHIEFWQHLHNLYFQVLVEYGLIGFFFWIGGLGSMIYRSLRMTISETQLLQPFFMISILAYLVHNVVDMLAVNSLDLLFVFLLALTSRRFLDSRRQSP